MGDIVGDINRRRGQVNDMGTEASKTIKQMCHYQMFGYVTTLRTLSSGKQHLQWNFHITQRPLIFQEQY
jgi:elongation factor G